MTQKASRIQEGLLLKEVRAEARKGSDRRRGEDSAFQMWKPEIRDRIQVNQVCCEINLSRWA